VERKRRKEWSWSSSSDSSSQEERVAKRRKEKQEKEEEEEEPHYTTTVDGKRVDYDVPPDFKDTPSPCSSSSSLATQTQLISTQSQLGIRKVLFSVVAEKTDKTAHLHAPFVFVPYDIRQKRVGEKEYIQVFLPSPPSGWKFTIKPLLEIPFTLTSSRMDQWRSMSLVWRAKQMTKESSLGQPS
jgi:hypothetical protein